MVRERVDVEGNIRALEAPESLPCLSKTNALEGYIPESILERFLEGKQLEPRPKRKSKIVGKFQALKMKRQQASGGEEEVEKLVSRLKLDESPPPSAMAGRIGTVRAHFPYH